MCIPHTVSDWLQCYHVVLVQFIMPIDDPVGGGSHNAQIQAASNAPAPETVHESVGVQPYVRTRALDHWFGLVWYGMLIGLVWFSIGSLVCIV